MTFMIDGKQYIAVAGGPANAPADSVRSPSKPRFRSDPLDCWSTPSMEKPHYRRRQRQQLADDKFRRSKFLNIGHGDARREFFQDQALAG